MKLYRAVSQNEKDDYDLGQLFRTGRNTLEAKQFFKSKSAASTFVDSSVIQAYFPPYLYLMTITVDEQRLSYASPEHIRLDGYDAINIAEEDLLAFNNSVTFVEQEEL